MTLLPSVENYIRETIFPEELRTVQGDVYYLDPNAGSDGYSGKTPGTAFKTLEYAEGKLTANQNDVLYYLAGSSSTNVTAELAWDKSYTHFIGICAPVPWAKRARIFNSGTSIANLLDVSGTGCIMKNFYIFQGGSNAAALGCVTVSGERCYFENVHFAGIGHATPGAQAGAFALKLTGSECCFKDCVVGVDTIKRTTNTIILVDGSATRNWFKDCLIQSYCETAGSHLLKLADTSSMDRTLIFEGCTWYNFWENHGGTITECFDIPGSHVTADIILRNNMLIGIDEWDATDCGWVWVDGTMTSATAEDAGLAVNPVNT